jgi:hypothetical protein
VLAGLPPFHQPLVSGDTGARDGGAFQRGVEFAIGDVESEGGKVDFGCAERHRRAAHEPRRRIDDAHGLQGFAMLRKHRSQMQRVEITQGRVHDRGRTPVARRRLWTDERRPESRIGKGQRRDQADRAGSRDQDIILDTFHRLSLLSV